MSRSNENVLVPTATKTNSEEGGSSVFGLSEHSGHFWPLDEDTMRDWCGKAATERRTEAAATLDPEHANAQEASDPRKRHTNCT